MVEINLLKHATVPKALGLHPKHADTIPHSGRAPWINTEILITHGPLKGTPGIIIDVLCNQSTPSGLRVVVQITSFNPNAPFQRAVMDYDFVVEARLSYFGPVEQLLTLTISRCLKLHQVMQPKAGVFMPRTSQPLESSSTLIHQIEPPLRNLPGNATPFPESSLPSSESPAWDPSSRTPQHNLHFSCASLASLSQSDPEDALLDPPHLSCADTTSPSQPDDQEHVLLDPRLVDVNVRVVVNNGEEYHNKELTAFIASTNGQLSIRRRKYKASEYLSPEWVIPKYPNPRRENGLLIVIKGEHFGKYVRRIYHRFVDGLTEPIAILAVVNRVADEVDTLLAVDPLELDASHLCVCDESIDNKTLNNQLMQPLRDEARKKRAK